MEPIVKMFNYRLSVGQGNGFGSLSITNRTYELTLIGMLSHFDAYGPQLLYTYLYRNAQGDPFIDSSGSPPQQNFRLENHHREWFG